MTIVVIFVLSALPFLLGIRLLYTTITARFLDLPTFGFGLLLFLFGGYGLRYVWGLGPVVIKGQQVVLHNLFGRERRCIDFGDIEAKASIEKKTKSATHHLLVLTTKTGRVTVSSYGVKNFHGLVRRLPSRRKHDRRLREAEYYRERRRWRNALLGLSAFLLLTGVFNSQKVYPTFTEADLVALTAKEVRVTTSRGRRGNNPRVTFSGGPLQDFRGYLLKDAFTEARFEAAFTRAAQGGISQIWLSRKEYEGKLQGKSDLLDWRDKHFGYGRLDIYALAAGGKKYGNRATLNAARVARNAAYGHWYLIGLSVVIASLSWWLIPVGKDPRGGAV